METLERNEQSKALYFIRLVQSHLIRPSHQNMIYNEQALSSNEIGTLWVFVHVHVSFRARHLPTRLSERNDPLGRKCGKKQFVQIISKFELSQFLLLHESWAKPSISCISMPRNCWCALWKMNIYDSPIQIIYFPYVCTYRQVNVLNGILIRLFYVFWHNFNPLIEIINYPEN